MKKFFFTLCLAILFSSALCFAHPGKTDSEGGHKDKKDVSGLGAYHYHHGQEAHLHEDGICPFEDKKETVKIPDIKLKLKSASFAEHTESFVQQ